MQHDVLYGLKLGNQVLAELHQQMKIGDVEKLMSETAEGIAYQKVSMNQTVSWSVTESNTSQEVNELLMSEMHLVCAYVLETA